MESETLLVTAETLREATLYAGIAVLCAALAVAGPKASRRGVLVPAAFALLMLFALWLLVGWGGLLRNRTLYDIAREGVLGLLAVAVIRALLQFAAGTLLARFNVPAIVTDVLLGLAVIVYALVRLNEVGVNLAGIVTTSAVITGAIAFSAQEVLGALWAGLSLQADRTLRLGDWIRFEGVVGRVEAIRWRTTAVRTHTNEIVVIPNALLIKQRLQVVLRPGSGQWPRCQVGFVADYDHPPGQVTRMVAEALRRADIDNVLPDPAPSCHCNGFEDSGIGYEVHYYLEDYTQLVATDSDVRAHVFAALRRGGVRVPFPQRDVHLRRVSDVRWARGEIEARVQALAGIELFRVLSESERRELAQALECLPFAAGDVLFRQGEAADSLYVLAAGRLSVCDEGKGGQRKLLASLAAPAYVGEMGLLTGQPRGATVIADGEVTCYRLDKAGFDAILRSRPDIVDVLSHVLAQRQADNDATLAALSAEDRDRRTRGRAGELVRRIRQFFALAER